MTNQPVIQDRLAALHQQREENSNSFFHLNAHKFHEQQDLIASYQQYADVVAQSHIASHAAYIAWQLGRTVKFDPVKEEFLGDEEANRLRSRAKREPWRI